MPQIQPVDIVAPGRFGLNTEAASTLLRPEWATKALNVVINRAGRAAARKGWEKQTTTGITGNDSIVVLHEYLQEDGTSIIISAAGKKIYKNITDFSDISNDITSSTAPTANNWQFINFNDFVLGYQKGHTPIQWQGSSDFANQSFTGTGPDGNCACAAFGRVWVADADLQTIRYSALLDHDDFSTATGGGTIDMSSVWTLGMDQIVAIAAIGSNFVVFGKRHIIMWADGSGSELGLDPTQMEVVDTIEGTGCIARDSVQPTGEGDLIFLSRVGIQSLSRVLQSKSNPLVTLTKHVRSDIITDIMTSRAADTELDEVRSVFSPEEGFYLLNFPTTENIYCIDLHHPFQDEDGDIVFPVTKWAMSGSIRGMLVTVGGSLLLGSDGVVGKYSGNDDDGVSYDLELKTGWLDFGELNHRLKILKEIVVSVSISASASLTWTWEFDFNGSTLTRTTAYKNVSGAEFGESEFNVGEFAGGVSLNRRALPAHGEGQFIRLGVTARVNAFDVVIQQISIAPKIGRAVT